MTFKPIQKEPGVTLALYFIGFNNVLLNEESYVSTQSMTYAVSEWDDSKIRSIFEKLIERTPSQNSTDSSKTTSLETDGSKQECKRYCTVYPSVQPHEQENQVF